MLSTVISATRPVRYRWDQITFRRSADTSALVEQKDRYRGRPMLVVGNGPSLNKTPLDEFRGIPSIGMNKIDLIFSRVDWRPSIVVCVNNLVVKQHMRAFVDSDIPIFLSWKARRFIPRRLQDSVNYFLSLDFTDFSFDLTKGVGFGSTVTYTALQFAYYMGADPVILVGVDHSFSFKGSAMGIAKRQGEDQNHFDPNYFKSGTYWGLPDLDGSEVAYGIAKRVFEADGRRVLDATMGGNLQIFNKLDISDAVRLVRD